MNAFKEFGLADWLLEGVKKQHIKAPTEIQKRAIPQINEGLDVIAQAPTGTGKTLAYLLPSLNRLSTHSKTLQMLILAPTRELALQITEETKKMIEGQSLTLLAVYGGVDTQSQLKKLDKGIDIIVATPGRLIDHMKQGSIDLSKLKILVLDEADQMLLLGFKNEVEFILKNACKDLQLLCFSATLDRDVKKLAYRYMRSPVECSAVTETVTLENIEQKLIVTSDRWKTEALLHSLEYTNPFLGVIFCRTIRRVDKLEFELSQRGISCEKLHGDLSQNVRQRTMKAFREGKFQYLVTTDVAARGLDISGVSHIYNYDLPETAEIYIHRIGRTGRMGGKGHAISFISQKDEIVLTDIEKAIEMKLPRTQFERPEGFVDRSHRHHNHDSAL